MARVRALVAVLVLVVVGALGAAAAAPTDLDPAQRSHLEALRAARSALDAPRVVDDVRAARAAGILRTGAAGEAEAIGLLEARPPGLAAARARLDGSIRGFEIAARDPDPSRSAARLGSILAESRFHPESAPLAGFFRALNEFFGNVLNVILTSSAVHLAALLVAVLVVIGAVVLLVPSLRQPLLRARGRAGESGGPLDDGVPEYFRAADALAAAGDFAAAVRALTAGTMELVSGERSYTASPLTVRETFRRSGQLEVLRPLLRAFESSYYGHYQTDRAAYLAAAEAAAAYRRLVSAAVAA